MHYLVLGSNVMILYHYTGLLKKVCAWQLLHIFSMYKGRHIFSRYSTGCTLYMYIHVCKAENIFEILLEHTENK